ncbi:sodium- and chloride-dependent transporter XTRP3 isoform X1 [Elephas maximus indicus]|uniref:sodium- and chloride-dependent transporter XTRP3 isoform X1 n=1 Tax=Elephas maximus indicus TaxID=99487 RepID=UPI002115F692|nr:sodium- and chloride-dependent transporter XTRP3 isoform X1 [Elephas maximus indicus]
MEKTRPLWANPLQFVFACISYAVGLGNVWRFPYLCQMYGGGSFLVPYIIMLIVEGMPLLYLELAVGQRMRQGSIGAWRTISPYLSGVGVASVVVSFFLSMYYNVINAWGFWYLFHSFQVVYFTALLPYCVLIIYLVRGLTLHGATNGLAYMFTPKLEQLANPRAWINAATQIFFSLGLGFGSLIAFASYNEPSNNCQRHAIIVSLINSFTSIFASIVTFSIYGFKATFNYENCLRKVILLLTNSFDLEDGFLTASNLEQVKTYLASTYPSKYSEVFPQIKNCSLESELNTAVQGTGLAFIVYTEAIKNMEVSQLWSVLYFFMLLMLGIGSMLGNTAAILTPLTDSKVISSHLPKEAISGRQVSRRSCAVGLVFTMDSGNYWFDIFNDYAATLSLLLIVLVETIAICYVYGLRRFESDLQSMTGRSLNWYWKVMWAGVSPLLIVSLFIFYLSDYFLMGTLQYQAWDASQGQLVTKDYPTYVLVFIGLLVASSTMCIPLVALGTFVMRHLQRGDTAPLA